ncbi:MAG: hypothetical protein M0Z76_00765 [Gammaproteobacteria bacterium]|nr:hypothetical protein [Gammaproteobacteria bacterium]
MSTETKGPVPENEGRVAINRILDGAQDALTDEMVGRLAEAMSASMTMLDEASRLKAGKVLPVLVQLAESGDLERLSHVARLVGAAQDALTDEMVVRMTAVVGRLLELLDRANDPKLERFVALLVRVADYLDEAAIEKIARVIPTVVEACGAIAGSRECREGGRLMVGVIEAMQAAGTEAANQGPMAGGVMGLWHLAMQPRTQEAIRYLSLVADHLRKVAKPGV